MGITPPCSMAYIADENNESSQVLSNSVFFSSQPSLPSLNFRDHLPPPSLHQCITTLKGHSSYISSLTVHDKSLYSGSSDQDIRLWTSIPSDPPSHQSIPPSFIVAATKSPVKSLAISGDNLFSSHQDHKIRVWQINHHQEHPRYKLRAVLPTPKDRFLSLLLPRNYVQVRRHKKCTWVHHVDAISGLALSHDGALLYSVSWDRTLKVWRTSDFKCMESLAAAHHDAINAITVSWDGYIYTGSADTTIKAWRRHAEEKKHSLVATLKRHKSAVNALALSADGSVLYSGACDRSVVVWEGGGGLMAATGALRGHTRAILSLAATAELVCSGSADGTVRVWRRGEDKRYSCLSVLEGHGRPVKSLAMVGVESHIESNSSYLVFSGGMDCDIKVWKLLVPPLEGIM
ncbi:protein JINGUBANG [Elaeis guineensis]|uniref:Protein JINGUBANG n=1 Tax=Elaeis guineensis var. tenera TaxID=51953 RepID=A0A6I9RMU5_ELAGV|nr:protein JINGUBANG [Elaeis guineensis]